MEPICGDAYLSAQAVDAAVRETGGGVDDDGGTVYFLGKFVGKCDLFGYDGFGVP